MTGLMQAAGIGEPAAWNAEVDAWVAQAIPRVVTFEDLVRALPGVTPEDALRGLRRVGGARAASLEADAEVDRSPSGVDQCRGLPLPHPLDSEFRFDKPTARGLARSLLAATAPGEEILLVGTPTVALELASICSDRLVRFVGPEDSVSAAVAAAFSDGRLALGEGSAGTAAAALADPPWYVGPFGDMLWACSRGCRAGVPVWAVLPPVGARPGARSDRAEFLRMAAAMGLWGDANFERVRYRTPLFELAAMERQGIGRLADWRSGDLVRLAVGPPQSPSGPLRTPRPCELTLRGVRIRLLRDGRSGGAGPTTLSAVGADEVFSTVSSRGPGRDRANLWTTGNRAFEVDVGLASAALAAIARAGAGLLHLGFEAPQIHFPTDSGIAPPNCLIHQLLELIGRELDDARRLTGDGAWLETGMDWRC